VVLDLKLPKESGLNVLEWIRSSAEIRALPVVVLTSSREPSDVSRTRELGIDSYEVKPVKFEELLAIVRSICKRWLDVHRWR